MVGLGVCESGDALSDSFVKLKNFVRLSSCGLYLFETHPFR